MMVQALDSMNMTCVLDNRTRMVLTDADMAFVVDRPQWNLDSDLPVD